jgi:hypothetical protein
MFVPNIYSQEPVFTQILQVFVLRIQIVIQIFIDNIQINIYVHLS